MIYTINGEEWRGKYKPSTEYPFHLGMYNFINIKLYLYRYEVKNDIKAIAHAHCPSLVTFCVTHQDLLLNYMPVVGNIINHIEQIIFAPPGTKKLV